MIPEDVGLTEVTTVPADAELPCRGQAERPDRTGPDQQGPSDTTRISQDNARRLKQLAQHAYGYAAGMRRLRQDLGFEPDESVRLRYLGAHVSRATYEGLVTAYGAQIRQAGEADVP